MALKPIACIACMLHMHPASWVHAAAGASAQLTAHGRTARGLMACHGTGCHGLPYRATSSYIITCMAHCIMIHEKSLHAAWRSGWLSLALHVNAGGGGGRSAVCAQLRTAACGSSIAHVPWRWAQATRMRAMGPTWSRMRQGGQAGTGVPTGRHRGPHTPHARCQCLPRQHQLGCYSAHYGCIFGCRAMPALYPDVFNDDAPRDAGRRGKECMQPCHLRR